MTPSTASHTRAKLAADLRALGVSAGDLIFIHSSFKSLGSVEGGAGAVVAALEDAVGPAGLILMPSFNLVDGERHKVWNHAKSPSTVGWLTEYFRTMPGTIRSDHYSHAVAARGRGDAEIVARHRSIEGMRSPWDREPWGATYGTHSPMLEAYRRNGKVLMLGVDYHSSTYMHVVECMDWNARLPGNPAAEYYWINREALGAHWDSLGRLSRGKVGDADCRLFPIRDFVDTLVAAVKREPKKFFKWYPGV
jgi:aminoglycoside 3-N-acetyltransferase